MLFENNYCYQLPNKQRSLQIFDNMVMSGKKKIPGLFPGAFSILKCFYKFCQLYFLILFRFQQKNNAFSVYYCKFARNTTQ